MIKSVTVYTNSESDGGSVTYDRVGNWSIDDSGSLFIKNNVLVNGYTNNYQTIAVFAEGFWTRVEFDRG